MRYGKIITVSREYAKDALGKTFSRLNGRGRFYIYKHDVCPFSGGPVETFELAGRTVYFSPEWQGGVDDEPASETPETPLREGGG